jgi:hypothetical protein
MAYIFRKFSSICYFLPGASSWTIGELAATGLKAIVATQTRWYSNHVTRLTTKEL